MRDLTETAPALPVRRMNHAPYKNRFRNLQVIHRLAWLKDWIGGSRIKVSGSANRVNLDNVRLVRSRVCVDGFNNHLAIEPDTRLIDSHISVRGNGHRIKIGPNCILGGLTLVLQSSDCAVEIGEGTTSGSANIDLGEPNVRLTIGRDCMISHRVEIMCGDGHSLDDAVTGERLNHPRDIVIGDHVWLAAESAILKGASVGDHSTVGFRSVVTSAIPAHSVAIGIPARVIRFGVTWTRELPWQSLDKRRTCEVTDNSDSLR